MSHEALKKKNRNTKYLFPYNRFFAEKKRDWLNHPEDIKQMIAKRFHIAYRVDCFSSIFGIGSIVVGLFFCMFGTIFTTTAISVLDFVSFAFLFGLLYLIMSIFLFYCGFITLNYNPNELEKLYEELLTSGQILRGHIISIKTTKYDNGHWPTRKTWTIKYAFILQKETQIKGTITFSSIERSEQIVLSSRWKHVTANTPIYILYANKRLHTPL